MTTLQNISYGIKTILGVGDFGRLYREDIGEYADPLPPLPVPEDIAMQYDNEAMADLGWRVTREATESQSASTWAAPDADAA